MSVVVLALSVLPLVAQSNMNAQEQANLKFVLDWWREVIQVAPRRTCAEVSGRGLHPAQHQHSRPGARAS